NDAWAVLLGVALVTMIVGALGAIAQNDLNRMLSFLLVSHIGYMLFGLALFTVTGLAGVILYVVHHITVQGALFLVSGLVTRHTGTVSLQAMSGVARAYPLVAVLFAIPAMSLAGIPPFSGFVAKIALLQAGAASGTPMAIAVTAGAVLTSLLTLYAVTKIWVGAFWGPPTEPLPDADPNDDVTVGTGSTSAAMLGATGGLVLISVLIAVFAGPLADMSERAAHDLLHDEGYRSAVLGEGNG